jgi:hypothetical protein
VLDSCLGNKLSVRDELPLTESLFPREALKALRFAHIAQSVEHFLGKEEVTGSNPVVGSRIMVY